MSTFKTRAGLTEAEFAQMMALYDKKHPSRKVCTWENWNLAWKYISLILAILTLVTVLIATIWVPRQLALQRVCVHASEINVVGGPGEAGARLWGPVEFDINDKRLTFKFQHNAALSQITSIHIKGPIVTGTEEGPIAAVLCGGPGPLPACDLTTPGEVQYTLVKDIYDGMSSGSEDPDVFIRRYRENQAQYYLEVLTTGAPTSPGAVRAPLNAICGWPV
jgi:hypothetical protein